MTDVNRRDYLYMIVGMTFLWSYLRYQTVIQSLFHKADTICLFGTEFTALTVFLLVAAILGVITTMGASHIDQLVIRNRVAVLVLGCLGSVGILLNFRMNFFAVSDPLAGILFWISTILFTLGFLVNLVSWAHQCSRVFCAEVVVALAVSFILSLVFFAVLGSNLPGMKRFVLVLTPAIIQLCWFADTMGQSSTEEAMPEAEYLSIPNSKLIFILLFVAFLLCGSLIRGMVDIRNAYTTILTFRLYASVTLMTLIAVYTFYRMKRFNAGIRSHNLDGHDLGSMTDQDLLKHRSADIERTALACWVSLSLVFFAGLFLEFASPSADIGGQLVVVARSGLDFLLWVMLCNTVHAERLAPTRIVILFFFMVEVVSWMISYTLIPNLYAIGPGERLMDTLLITVMFLMVGTLTTLFAWFVLRKQNVFDQPTVTIVAPAAEPTHAVPADLAKTYKLTSREMEVITLFSQGYSLAKVAQELYISLGTAQSHIKSIYRKLDVHSKDELITLFDQWNAGK